MYLKILYSQRRRGLSRKCTFHVQIQAAITGFQTFYWSGRTAYPMNCQNKLVWQLGSVHKTHDHLEATSPLD